MALSVLGILAGLLTFYLMAGQYNGSLVVRVVAPIYGA
jgi:hypothetical protein